MNVPDLPTMNLILEDCGCCPLPICPEGTLICESLSRTSYCEDDDYTDDHAAWVARGDAYSSWVIDHYIWSVCDPPGTCGDEPVEPPAVGTEPTKPAGYDDVLHGCYAPFAEPSGDPDDRIPTIYRTLAALSTTIDVGSYYHYEPSITTELLNVRIWGMDGVPTDTATANSIIDDVCGPESVTPSMGGFDPDPGWTYEPTTYACTETTRDVETLGNTSFGTVPLELVGCPGPWGSDDEEAWDVDRTITYNLTLGDGITPPDLIARAVSNLPADWPATAEGSDCIASASVIWPTARDLYIGVDAEADPPDAGHWLACDELPDSDHALPATAEATVNKVRYKVGIPTEYMAHRLWLIDKAAWDACELDTPGECGPAPAEPQIFHYFASQWDVVKFPAAWDAWRSLFDAWNAAVAAHAVWVVDHAAWVTAGSDPETEPVEPTVPADPSADQPDDRPEFIDENLFWEWTGGETEAAQYSDFFYIDAPTEESQIRRVNEQRKCWQSASRGVPPTFSGEIYNPDDYPA